LPFETTEARAVEGPVVGRLYRHSNGDGISQLGWRCAHRLADAVNGVRLLGISANLDDPGALRDQRIALPPGLRCWWLAPGRIVCGGAKQRISGRIGADCSVGWSNEEVADFPS